VNLIAVCPLVAGRQRYVQVNVPLPLSTTETKVNVPLVGMPVMLTLAKPVGSVNVTITSCPAVGVPANLNRASHGVSVSVAIGVMMLGAGVRVGFGVDVTNAGNVTVGNGVHVAGASNGPTGVCVAVGACIPHEATGRPLLDTFNVVELLFAGVHQNV